MEDFAIGHQAPGLTALDARLSSALGIAADGIIVIDEQARILLFDRACERLFGYASSEVLGTSIGTILPPANAADEDRSIWICGGTDLSHRTSVVRETGGRHQDGTVFPVAVSLGEVRTPKGRQFTCVIHDLRSARDAKQRVDQLQADLLHMSKICVMDDLGAALAHELNQPLTALMLYLQAAERMSVQQSVDASPPGPTIEILEKAVHEAERAANIIQRMRRFAEKREPVRRPLDLTLLIDDAVELTLLGAHSGMRVTRDFTPNLPPVPVDPVQVQQIVVNLVRNALEAVKDQTAPEVRICTMQRADSVVVTVGDNGAGIPAEAVPHLFKAFFSWKRNGIGLGLALSKAIAQSHGGDLTVDPGGDGKGATFTLHLPLPPAVASPVLTAAE